MKYYNDGNVFLKLKTKMFFNDKVIKTYSKDRKEFYSKFFTKDTLDPTPWIRACSFLHQNYENVLCTPLRKNPCYGPENIDHLCHSLFMNVDKF